MSEDGFLFGGSDDDNNSFSVTFLDKRIIVGVGLLVDNDVFRILFNDGSFQDYNSTGFPILHPLFLPGIIKKQSGGCPFIPGGHIKPVYVSGTGDHSDTDTARGS